MLENRLQIEPTLDAIVTISAQVPAEAMTAEVLGTERRGHGIAIHADGLVLTIGYLIAEAAMLWITARDGRTVPAYTVGYDYETGFGLVRGMQPLDLPAVRLGESALIEAGDKLVVAGFGSRSQVVRARVIATGEFAGHWEYIINDAVYTAPAHRNWAGAGLFGNDGLLYGVGSLLVQHLDSEGNAGDANMHVPVDLLKPIIGELRELGTRRAPARPWLGLFVHESENGFAIDGMYRSGPAAAAGLQSGDVILAVSGTTPATLADLFRCIWQQGPAGTPIPLTIQRDMETLDIAVPSADRRLLMRPATLH